MYNEQLGRRNYRWRILTPLFYPETKQAPCSTELLVFSFLPAETFYGALLSVTYSIWAGPYLYGEANKVMGYDEIWLEVRDVKCTPLNGENA